MHNKLKVLRAIHNWSQAELADPDQVVERKPGRDQ